MIIYYLDMNWNAPHCECNPYILWQIKYTDPAQKFIFFFFFLNSPAYLLLTVGPVMCGLSKKSFLTFIQKQNKTKQFKVDGSRYPNSQISLANLRLQSVARKSRRNSDGGESLRIQVFFRPNPKIAE